MSKFGKQASFAALLIGGTAVVAIALVGGLVFTDFGAGSGAADARTTAPQAEDDVGPSTRQRSNAGSVLWAAASCMNSFRSHLVSAQRRLHIPSDGSFGFGLVEYQWAQRDGPQHRFSECIAPHLEQDAQRILRDGGVDVGGYLAVARYQARLVGLEAQDLAEAVADHRVVWLDGSDDALAASANRRLAASFLPLVVRLRRAAVELEMMHCGVAAGTPCSDSVREIFLKTAREQDERALPSENESPEDPQA